MKLLCMFFGLLCLSHVQSFFLRRMLGPIHRHRMMRNYRNRYSRHHHINTYGIGHEGYTINFQSNPQQNLPLQEKLRMEMLKRNMVERNSVTRGRPQLKCVWDLASRRSRFLIRRALSDYTKTYGPHTLKYIEMTSITQTYPQCFHAECAQRLTAKIVTATFVIASTSGCNWRQKCNCTVDASAKEVKCNARGRFKYGGGLVLDVELQCGETTTTTTTATQPTPTAMGSNNIPTEENQSIEYSGEGQDAINNIGEGASVKGNSDIELNQGPFSGDESETPTNGLAGSVEEANDKDKMDIDMLQSSGVGEGEENEDVIISSEESFSGTSSEETTSPEESFSGGLPNSSHQTSESFNVEETNGPDQASENSKLEDKLFEEELLH